MTPEITAALFRARAERRPLVLATRLPDGRQRILPDAIDDALQNAARLALDRDQSGTVDLAGESWFLHVHNLPVRVFVIGAVHIAQALVRLTAPLDMTTIVIDPRPALATVERFPGVELMLDWPDEALDLAKLDARSAIVVLTHDPRLVVSESRLHETLVRLKDHIESLNVGAATDSEVQIGSKVSRKQWERAQSYIRLGVDEGAVLLTGGEGRAGGLECGWFVRPTVFTHVTNQRLRARRS
jgi:Aldehyde dehydrogenase family/XdhC Rossmann domain